MILETEHFKHLNIQLIYRPLRSNPKEIKGKKESCSSTHFHFRQHAESITFLQLFIQPVQIDSLLAWQFEMWLNGIKVGHEEHWSVTNNSHGGSKMNTFDFHL